VSDDDDIVHRDPWAALRTHTVARIALGRTGASLPTAELLRFGVAHAQARDAVHRPLDVDALRAALQALGWRDVIDVASAAPDRATYLRRPDLGRRLAAGDGVRLATGNGDGDCERFAARAPCDILCIVADGLSADAAQRHAAPLLQALQPRLARAGLTLGAPVIARQARVALGDEIGAALGARLVVMLIGERPGLSAPDSLGAYLTAAPRAGRTDAERNCVSNIRPEGLSYDAAAHTIAWLCEAALAGRGTGVALEDRSGAGREGPSAITTPT
jgi:ethanolamine ammonia-lyase small subunit